MTVDVTFFHGNKEKTFYHCENVEEAKARFQWRYGYWPNDVSIVNVVETPAE